MIAPAMINAPPAQIDAARALLRPALDELVDRYAARLGEQPLSTRQLLARLLIEDFTALDVAATEHWLEANIRENRALRCGGRRALEDARQDRRDALMRLALTQIQRGEFRR